ncbi:MAG: hypothetical protein L0H83_02840 [Salinisphaera sp.]|nr:hypothetical protein [Salinisphaera sp.]
MTRPELIIRTSAQTQRRRVWAVVIGVVLLLVGAGLYALGRYQAPEVVDLAPAPPVNLEPDADAATLLAQLGRLRVENQKLTRKLVAQQRSKDIDQAATEALRESIRTMQAQIAALKRNLTFYRGIVSPKKAEAGLRVQTLRVLPSPDAQVFLLHVILIQASGHDDKVAGRIQIHLKGLRDGKPVSIAWSKLALDSSSKLAFGFRYFQELGGIFRVPETVRPTMLVVQVKPRNGDEITRNYRWQEVLGPRG